MVAYDLDGVFLPDIHYDPASFKMVHQVRTLYLKPIFTPVHPFAIITGRPQSDAASTLKWINAAFAHKPVGIYIGNTNLDDPVSYKAAVLNANPQLTTYVESDPAQAEAIQSRVKCRVVHFETMLKTMLQWLE